MTEWNKLELSYLAGLFDGEGSIQIAHVHKSHSPGPGQHELRVQIGSTNQSIIEWVKLFIQSGSIQRKMTAGYPLHRKPMWYWHLASQTAEDFLKLIYPFSKMKKAT